MPQFSIKKLNEIRASKNYTLKDIAAATEIPLSTISKIFAGIHKNPSIESVQKIAKALQCGIDDFIEYEEEPSSAYYLDRKTGEIAQEIFENPDLRILLDASRKLTPEEMQIVINVANGLKKNH